MAHTAAQSPATTRLVDSNPAPTPTLVQLHMQAHNGLSAALRILTDVSASDADTIRRALGRAMRATTALKRACAQLNETGAV
jgi:hypothetical protein